MSMYSEAWRNEQPHISAGQRGEELPKPLSIEALTRASYELSVGAQVALASCIGAWKVCTHIFLRDPVYLLNDLYSHRPIDSVRTNLFPSLSLLRIKVALYLKFSIHLIKGNAILF